MTCILQLSYRTQHLKAPGCAWQSSCRPSKLVFSQSVALVRHRSISFVTCCSADTPQQQQTRQHNKQRHRSNKQQQPSKQQLTEDDPLALAFLGDAIWSLYVRNHFLNPPKHHRLYQAEVQPYITAEGQAKIYDTLVEQQLLTQQEQQYLRYVYKWKDVKFRKRFSSPAAEAVYRKATALEALVGYLHKNQPDRLEELVKAVLPASTTASNATPQ